MIYLYTKKREAENWILKNDLYFNLFTSNLPFTDTDKEAISRIDGARLTGDGRIETRYGVGTVRNLSSGCKTYLNVIKNPDKVVSVKECGGDVSILIDDRELVVGREGYEIWWNEEYRRREEDDL